MPSDPRVNIVINVPEPTRQEPGRVKRRFAMALDHNVRVVSLAALRNLVRGADHEGFRDDSEFEIFREDSFPGMTFLALNEVTE